MNSFSTIKTNVGTRIGDTSSTFGSVIGGYINQRYQRIFRKFNFESITPSYTFPTVASTNEYTLPSGFLKELYVFDNTNLIDLTNIPIQDQERIYGQNINNSDNPVSYGIYTTLDGNSPANIIKKIRLYPSPTSVITILLPYLNDFTALSASTDLPILDMSDLAVELGATADAWRTKRQFQKAADFESQYEQIIQEMIWSQENQPNKVTQFRPTVYPRENLYGGDSSSYTGWY